MVAKFLCGRTRSTCSRKLSVTTRPFSATNLTSEHGPTAIDTTVIVPMRNAGRYITPALQSILGQRTTATFEIVVVNDASTDECDLVVAAWPDPRVRMIQGGGKGEANAVNLAVAEARGEYVMRCDADDEWTPDRMEFQLSLLRAHPEFQAVCGAMGTMSPDGRIRAAATDTGGFRDITDEIKNGITRASLCTYAMRTEAFRAVEGCRTWFAVAPDIDLQYRFAERFRVGYHPRMVYWYRLHATSVTHTVSSARRIFFDESARAFQLQRQAGRKDDLELGNPGEPPAHAAGAGGAGHSQQAVDPRAQLQGHLLGAAWRLHARGDLRGALRISLSAVRVRWWHWTGWWSGVALVLRALRSGDHR